LFLFFFSRETMIGIATLYHDERRVVYNRFDAPLPPAPPNPHKGQGEMELFLVVLVKYSPHIVPVPFRRHVPVFFRERGVVCFVKKQPRAESSCPYMELSMKKFSKRTGDSGGVDCSSVVPRNKQPFLPPCPCKGIPPRFCRDIVNEMYSFREISTLSDFYSRTCTACGISHY